MVKKIFPVVLLVTIIALLFAGCAITYNFNTPTFKEFKKNIMKQNDKIEKITAEYWTPALSIAYTLKDDATDKDVDDILKETEQLINGEEFQKEFFKEYFSRYKSSDSALINDEPVKAIYYPDIDVEFHKSDKVVRMVKYTTKRIEYGTWEYKYNGKVDYYKLTDDIVDIPIQ
ncbi:MAG: hypothetical protein PWP48_994 [Clostridiales bacterium]|nr:hypothetical protein [Clostridiales bacterium]